jgi:hypothetical protein
VWTFTLLVRSFRDDVLTFLSRDETVPADGESTPVFSRRTPKGAKTSRLKPLKHPRKGLTKSTSPATESQQEWDQCAGCCNT